MLPKHSTALRQALPEGLDRLEKLLVAGRYVAAKGALYLDQVCMQPFSVADHDEGVAHTVIGFAQLACAAIRGDPRNCKEYYRQTITEKDLIPDGKFHV